MTLKELKSKHDIVEVLSGHISIKRDGNRYIALCPFHNERSPSFVISPTKQIFKCFGCGKAGDVFDFFTLQGKTLDEAKHIIQNTQPSLMEQYKPDRPQSVWTPIDSAPFFSLHRSPRFFHYKHGEPSQVYTYRSLTGEIIGYTCRFEMPDGGKQVLPFTYCRSGDQEQWRWQGFNRPRPLYNLHLLARRLGTIIVEGEKTADALQSVVGEHYNVITWIGGKEGVKHADWSPLSSSPLIIWPDNDQPGEDAARQIINILSTNDDIGIITNPKWAEKGWDFADSGWDIETTLRYLDENICEI